MPSTSTLVFKDEVLNTLAEDANVAQFVSFDQNLRQRYSRIRGYPANHQFQNVEAAFGSLLEAAPEHKVNIRSFLPDDPKGGEFVALLSAPQDVARHLRRLSRNFFTIVNESIDVRDGGVSGVSQGGLCEFAPGDTPRCVEQEEVTAALPQQRALTVLRKVYGVEPRLPYGPNVRVEFSLHPFPRGLKYENTIIWELQEVETESLNSSMRWPNAFSRMLGDKVYGLLIAETLSFTVPHTKVLARHVPPFSFGEATGSSYKWLRTCPPVKTPGKFTTVRGWVDPFALLTKEDPHGTQLSSVMVQDEVEAAYSGALVTGADFVPIIEGVKGFGDRFMLGERGPTGIPADLLEQLSEIHSRLTKVIGSVRAEWAYDGRAVWLLQVQQQAALSIGNLIYPGEPEIFWDFDVTDGLEKLRALIVKAHKKRAGIRLIGNVGMTSHLADVLRDAKIPSVKVARPKAATLVGNGRK